MEHFCFSPYLVFLAGGCFDRESETLTFVEISFVKDCVDGIGSVSIFGTFVQGRLDRDRDRCFEVVPDSVGESSLQPINQSLLS